MACIVVLGLGGFKGVPQLLYLALQGCNPFHKPFGFSRKVCRETVQVFATQHEIPVFGLEVFQIDAAAGP
jgi:hypothetical protein